MAKKLDFKVTNNMVEYEACIYGVEIALVARAKDFFSVWRFFISY